MPKGVTFRRKYSYRRIGKELKQAPVETEIKFVSWEKMQELPRYIARKHNAFHWFTMTTEYEDKLKTLTVNECLRLDMAEKSNTIRVLVAVSFR